MFGYSANTSFGHDCATLPKNLINPETKMVAEDSLELDTIIDMKKHCIKSDKTEPTENIPCAFTAS
jgi:hypothetical protein